MDKREMYVYSLFLVAGNNYFLNTDSILCRDLAGKIFRGARPLTITTRTTKSPFPHIEIKQFFRAHINPIKYSILYSEFGIPENQRVDHEILIDSIVEIFKEYTEKDETYVTNTVADVHNRLIMLPSHKSSINIPGTDFSYIREVGSVCPITGDKLIIKKDGEMISNYSLIKIYPDNLTSVEDSVFSVYKTKPLNLDDYTNIIAVSPAAEFIYCNSKDITIFQKLISVKSEIIKQTEMDNRIDDYDIEESIKDVILSLLNIDESKLKNLSLNALRIKDKIPPTEHVLIYGAQNYVMKYYNFINNFFVYLEGVKPGKPTKIAENIRWISTELQSHGLSPSEIIKTITEIILTKTKLPKKYYDFCNILVFYFLQHCEVLGT